VTIERRDGVAVARLDQEFDVTAAVGVREALLAALSNRDHGIVVNLEDVTFMDSAGINVLFELADRLESRQQQVAVVLPERAVVRRVVELVGLSARVSIYDSVDDATGGVPPADPE
jgi:anti-anti-sigma factor